MKKLILSFAAAALLVSCGNEQEFVTRQFWYTNYYDGGSSKVVDIVSPTTENKFTEDSINSNLDVRLLYIYADSVVLDSVITENL